MDVVTVHQQLPEAYRRVHGPRTRHRSEEGSPSAVLHLTSGSCRPQTGRSPFLWTTRPLHTVCRSSAAPLQRRPPAAPLTCSAAPLQGRPPAAPPPCSAAALQRSRSTDGRAWKGIRVVAVASPRCFRRASSSHHRLPTTFPHQATACHVLPLHILRLHIPILYIPTFPSPTSRKIPPV